MGTLPLEKYIYVASYIVNLVNLISRKSSSFQQEIIS